MVTGLLAVTDCVRWAFCFPCSHPAWQESQCRTWPWLGSSVLDTNDWFTHMSTERHTHFWLDVTYGSLNAGRSLWRSSCVLLPPPPRVQWTPDYSPGHLQDLGWGPPVSREFEGKGWLPFAEWGPLQLRKKKKNEFREGAKPSSSTLQTHRRVCCPLSSNNI